MHIGCLWLLPRHNHRKPKVRTVRERIKSDYMSEMSLRDDGFNAVYAILAILLEGACWFTLVTETVTLLDVFIITVIMVAIPIWWGFCSFSVTDTPHKIPS